MKEIINSVGTITTILVLALAAFAFKGHVVFNILAGAAIIYVTYFHDEYLKYLWDEEQEKKKDDKPQKE